VTVAKPLPWTPPGVVDGNGLVLAAHHRGENVELDSVADDVRAGSTSLFQHATATTPSLFECASMS
jgi:hypothetical protein